jgi:hypothetical protein
MTSLKLTKGKTFVTPSASKIKGGIVSVRENPHEKTYRNRAGNGFGVGQYGASRSRG